LGEIDPGDQEVVEDEREQGDVNADAGDQHYLAQVALREQRSREQGVGPQPESGPPTFHVSSVQGASPTDTIKWVAGCATGSLVPGAQEFCGTGFRLYLVLDVPLRRTLAAKAAWRIYHMSYFWGVAHARAAYSPACLVEAFSEVRLQNPERVWRLVLRLVSFRTVDAAPVITRCGTLNIHALSWMTLSSESQLEAHLWRPVC
jgi:hypothetical protein